MIAEASASERSDYVQRIQNGAQQALDLVRNVLDASAIEGRPLTPSRVPVVMNDLASGVLELYQPSLQAKRIRLRVDLAPGLPVVEADPQLLSRALGNQSLIGEPVPRPCAARV